MIGIARQRGACRLLLAGLAWLWVGASGACEVLAAENVWSTQQLMQAKPEWPRLLNSLLRVEGRLASHGKRQLRLMKCDLLFRLTDDQEKLVGSARHLELTGRLMRERETGRIFFEITSLKPLPNDRHRLLDRESQLKNAKAADWYELARWADERGRFYEDAELLNMAQTYYTRGVQQEWRELPGDDLAGRLRLATQARDWKLSPAFQSELLHEALYMWWNRALVARDPVAEWTALLERLETDWPAALHPLDEWPADLAEAYWHDPLAVYRRSDTSRRLVLQRIFATEVMLKKILATAERDRLSDLEIVHAIETLMPERRALADQYRDKSFQTFLQNVGAFSKTELLEYVQQLRQQHKSAQATQLIRQWLRTRAQRLSPSGGAPERLALADDYWSLLQDEATTVALLESARQLEPESEDVERRFRELGYRWTGSRWVKSAEPEPPPQPPTQLAVGLTASEVREIQGNPTRVATVLSASGIDEYWTYGEQTGSRLVIQLQRRERQNEFRVVRIFHR